MIIDTDWERYRHDTLFTKEPETIAWINSFRGGKDSLFIDVGANVGIYSLYAASKFPEMQIMAIEPHPETFYHLDMNCHENNFGNIIPVCCLVGSKSQIGCFTFSNCSAGSSEDITLSITRGVNIIKGYVQRIELSLDDIVKLFVPESINSIHIKIDTDGNELEIVDGMKELMFSGRLNGFLIELYGKGDIESLLKSAKDAGFSYGNDFNRMRKHGNVVFTRIMEVM